MLSLICRWIENDDGSQDVAEDKNTPCGTLAHVQARLIIDEKDKDKNTHCGTLAHVKARLLFMRRMQLGLLAFCQPFIDTSLTSQSIPTYDTFNIPIKCTNTNHTFFWQKSEQQPAFPILSLNKQQYV